MKLGKQSRYAIEGLLVLAKKPFGTTMQLRDIAEIGDMPENFLAKIFQKFNRAKLVTSSRGAVRGYALAQRAGNIRMKDIFLAIEGADVFERCAFWSDRCAESRPCPMHFHWKRAKATIAALVQRTTLADLSRE